MPTTDPAPREFLIVTGMSGAGRTSTANVLEDEGWYVVDNLPPRLLPDLARLGEELLAAEPGLRFAAVVDVRARHLFADLAAGLAEVKAAGWSTRTLFLDATDEDLVRRFESVRRPHPLQGTGRLLDGIRRERDLLRDLRSGADVVLDTSNLTIHQLARKLEPLVGAHDHGQLRLAVLSFGFKYGIPLDADFVLDLRFLPNPFWVPELKTLDGRDEQVAEYVLSRPETRAFLDRVRDMFDIVLDGYRREGRRYTTLAVGCTGGKHRSVAVAEVLATGLASSNATTFVVHRDLGRE